MPMGAKFYDVHHWVVDADLLVPVHPPELCPLYRVFERSRDEATGAQQSMAMARLEAEIRLDESRRQNGEMLEWLVDRGMDARRHEAENCRLTFELKAAREDSKRLHEKLREAQERCAAACEAPPTA